MNNYRTKTDGELQYIIKDAGEAAKAMKHVSAASESKYLDQVNDACTEVYRRRQAALKSRSNPLTNCQPRGIL